MREKTDDLAALGAAFHGEVVIHEPGSLPYGGDWRGLAGVGALFRRMREVWSDLRVRDLEAVRSGDVVFMRCTLELTARANGQSVEQPFAKSCASPMDFCAKGRHFTSIRGAGAAVGR